MINQQDLPIWDNTNVFTSLQDPTINSECERLSKFVQQLNEMALEMPEYSNNFDELNNEGQLSAVQLARRFTELMESNQRDIFQLFAFAGMALSVDSKNRQALELKAKAESIYSDFLKADKSLSLLLNAFDEGLIKEYLQGDLQHRQYVVSLDRARKDFDLGFQQENLVNGLSRSGLHAWSNLYFTISGSLKCQVGDEEMSLANASTLLQDSEEQNRKLAFKGIQNAWQQQEHSVAAILSGINGWRIEEFKARSKVMPLKIIEQSCFDSRIQQDTLDTLMSTVYEHRSLGQKSVKLMAKKLDKEQLAPWDLRASPTLKNESTYPFHQAKAIVTEAFFSFSDDMGKFAKMAFDKNWVDARPSENRSSGAFCSSFSKLKEPRVFMTYAGSVGDVITLAHELGHAYHYWLLRELPNSEKMYPMTLAETASIFAEDLVRSHLLAQATSDDDRLSVHWATAERAASFLCNIPARFELERDYIELRKEKPLTPAELKKITNEAWGKWYGDSLSEYDDMQWASKLHFSMSRTIYYNYPYLFGYLFSLGIAANRQSFGEEAFKELYENILLDTGRMSAESLIQKHLQKDISKPEFWQDSLKIVEGHVNQFEQFIIS